MPGRIKLAGNEPGHYAAEDGADFMGACGEPLANQGRYFGLYSGKLLRQHHVVHAAETSPFSLWFVLPAHPEEVARVNIP